MPSSFRVAKCAVEFLAIKKRRGKSRSLTPPKPRGFGMALAERDTKSWDRMSALINDVGRTT
jgi:hypothetical protein